MRHIRRDAGKERTFERGFESDEASDVVLGDGVSSSSDMLNVLPSLRDLTEERRGGDGSDSRASRGRIVNRELRECAQRSARGDGKMAYECTSFVRASATLLGAENAAGSENTQSRSGRKGSLQERQRKSGRSGESR